MPKAKKTPEKHLCLFFFCRRACTTGIYPSGRAARFLARPVGGKRRWRILNGPPLPHLLKAVLRALTRRRRLAEPPVKTLQSNFLDVCLAAWRSVCLAGRLTDWLTDWLTADRLELLPKFRRTGMTDRQTDDCQIGTPTQRRTERLACWLTV